MPDESFSDRPILIRQFLSHWRLKMAMAGVLGIGFTVVYFLLLYFPGNPVRIVPQLWTDHLIPFAPGWVWMYESFYILVYVLPLLADRREQLVRYTVGFSVLAAVSFLIFLAFPTAVVRPTAYNPPAMYELLLRIDRPNNAFPSLHAGLLVYTSLFVRRIYQGRLLLTGLYIWGTLIIYATLATKQHYTLDVMGGSVLALGAHAIAWSALCPRWPCSGDANSLQGSLNQRP